MKESLGENAKSNSSLVGFCFCGKNNHLTYVEIKFKTRPIIFRNKGTRRGKNAIFFFPPHFIRQAYYFMMNEPSAARKVKKETDNGMKF